MLHTGNGEPEEQGGNILNLQTILFHRNKDGLSANLLYYYPALRALLLPLSRAWLCAPFRRERSERAESPPACPCESRIPFGLPALASHNPPHSFSPALASHHLP